MTIKTKLVAGFMAVAMLAAVTGGFGIAASRGIVKSFEGGEEHFRSIVWAATEVTSFAKRAEGHLLQYLLLGDPEDREKFFQRYASLQEQIGILEAKIHKMEGKQLLDTIKGAEGNILKAGKILLAAYDQAAESRRKDWLEANTALLRQLEEAVAGVEKAGLRLANFETTFLNKQEAITAATELCSLIKRAETHLMLFLALGQESDREEYLGYCTEVRGEIGHLEDRLKTPESREMMKDILILEKQFFRLGKQLIEERALVTVRSRPSDEVTAERIRDFSQTASEIREIGVQIARIEAAMESRLKEQAIRRAEEIRRNILLVMVGVVVVSLVIGYLISRSILVPISRMNGAVAELGRGNFRARVKTNSADELGALADCFNRMAEDLQKSLVSVDYVENILKSMMDALIVLSAELKIERVNYAAGRLSGYAEPELLGKTLQVLLGEVATPLISRALAENCVGNTEVPLRTRAGDEIPALFSCSTMRGDDGQLTGMVCALRDMTDLKRAEIENGRLQAQLLHAQKMETLGTLAGGIAHDFNNLLTPILGFSRIVQNDVPKGSNSDQCLARVIQAAERARELVRQIGIFGRQGRGERQAIQMDVIVLEAIRLLQSTIPKTITVREHIEEGAVVMADPTQIHQIVMNLGTNAFHAMEKGGGTLEFRLESMPLPVENGPSGTPGGSVVLSVTDSGCGIDSAILGRIFEPFFTTKGVGKGTGLGLSVVHGIVHNHGGRITVDSRPGKGTVFRVYLPALPAKNVSRLGPTLPDPPAEGGRLLLVDDEESVAQVGRAMLERLGYEVTIASTPEAAKSIFLASPDRFDALITDVAMPGQNGIEMAKEMRRLRPELPVVLMTGFVGNLTDEKVVDEGGVVCVLKPYVPADIEKALQQALASGPFPNSLDGLTAAG